ncbi:hypothetical protein [Streptomyces botrytidirepellens]|uniref:hypothetical protein n=1 Tax=Streptomyces botrytidirepellens TaxID=2486417 RepID=UPI00160FC7D1|nr:hypothetical protein [Streptomyces botrytidirepellens]
MPAKDRDVAQIDVAHQKLRRLIEPPLCREQLAELDLAVEVASSLPAAAEPIGGLRITILAEQYAESVGAPGVPFGDGAVERVGGLPIAPDLPVPGKGVMREGVAGRHGHRARSGSEQLSTTGMRWV